MSRAGQKRNKLAADAVQRLRFDWSQAQGWGVSKRAMARRWHISERQVRRILAGENWKQV